MITSRRPSHWAGEAIEPNRVLYWIYAGRLMVCLSVFGSALLVGGAGASSAASAILQETRLVSLLGLALAGLVTPIAYWYSHGRPEKPGPVFLYSQAIVDVLLVTGTVHITGGSGSVFPPLFYIALTSGYAVILPLGSAVLVALSSGAFYLFDIALAYPLQLGTPVLLQVLIFTAVASITSVIGGRLRQERAKVRRLEGELHRLRLDTTDVLRTIDSAVATFDGMGRLAYMNPAAEELLDVDASAWLGRDLLRDMEDRAPRIASAVRRSLETGETVRNREARIRGRGGAIPVSVSTTVLSGSESARSVTVALQDLRPVRRLEELKVRASRLEAVAELSASLAHEIKNPLASIRSAAEQLDGSGEGRDEGEDRMLTELILRESDRLTRLLGEFSDFARVDVVDRRPVDVRSLVKDAVEVVRQHPDSDRARIEVEFDGELEDVWGDADLLHRSVTNLVLNGVQAGEPGEEVTVEVRVDELPAEDEPNEELFGSPVRIRVTDDGRGISADRMEQIFDPFYTSRTGGSGLGLSIAHRAIEAHGGALLVSSAPGEGSTFAVVLPRRHGARAIEPRDVDGSDAPAEAAVGGESADEAEMEGSGRASAAGQEPGGVP